MKNSKENLKVLLSLDFLSPLFFSFMGTILLSFGYYYFSTHSIKEREYLLMLVVLFSFFGFCILFGTMNNLYWAIMTELKLRRVIKVGVFILILIILVTVFILTGVLLKILIH